MMTEYDAMTEFGIDAVDCFASFCGSFCGIKCGANALWNLLCGAVLMWIYSLHFAVIIDDADSQ